MGQVKRLRTERFGVIDGDIVLPVPVAWLVRDGATFGRSFATIASLLLMFAQFEDRAALLWKKVVELQQPGYALQKLASCSLTCSGSSRNCRSVHRKTRQPYVIRLFWRRRSSSYCAAVMSFGS